MIYAIDILVIFLLVLLNGFFAMSEIAIVSSRKPRLKSLAEQRHRGAKVALRLAEQPARFLSTVQIGITFVGIFAGVFGGEELAPPLETYLETTDLLAPWSEELAILIIVAGITYASLIIGELVPKQLALLNAERIATLVAPPMALLSRIVAPLVYVLQGSSRLLLHLLSRGMREIAVTDEEVKAVIAEGVEEGVIAPKEQEMIIGVMRLADWRVRALMTPRRELAWVGIEDDPAEIERRIRATPYSRVLVTRGGLDRPLGIVQAKDLLQRCLAGQALDIKSMLRQPLYVHGNMLAIQLLEMFKKSPIHLAVVVDAQRSVEGIVTPTDVLKILLGGLAEMGIQAEPQIIERADGSWLLDGDLDIDVIKDLLRLKEISGEEHFYTLAGFILARLERLPTSGEHFEWEGFYFEVMDMDGPRIDKVLVARAPYIAPGPDQDTIRK